MKRFNDSSFVAHVLWIENHKNRALNPRSADGDRCLNFMTDSRWSGIEQLKDTAVALSILSVFIFYGLYDQNKEVIYDLRLRGGGEGEKNTCCQHRLLTRDINLHLVAGKRC